MSRVPGPAAAAGAGATRGAAGSAAADGLLSVEDALGRILRFVTPGPTEVVSLDDALGRVLAEAVTATTSLPPWDNSAMDGYAVRSADTRLAGEAAPESRRSLEVVGEVAAGVAPTVRVEAGSAIRIATGAQLPPGADAVVEVESTTPLGADGSAGPRGRDATGPLPARILVHRAVEPGTNIRRLGSDLRAGDVVLEPGRAIGASQIALLAGAGIPRTRVHVRPLVGVLATGDEIRPPGEALGDAGIPDANGPGLRALVRRSGAEPLDLGIARDLRDDVLERLRRAIDAGCAAVVVAGGVSVGPYDVVKAAFEALGRVDVWRVAVQPGKPFALGVVERPGRPAVLLFGLPGNPVSGLVTFELFVRPAIRSMTGRRSLFRALDRGLLLDEARTAPGRRAYLRATAEREPDGRIARDSSGRVRLRLARGPAGQGSHVLSALADAEALAIVPEATEIHRAGDPVDLLWLDSE